MKTYKTFKEMSTIKYLDNLQTCHICYMPIMFWTKCNEYEMPVNCLNVCHNSSIQKIGYRKNKVRLK